MHEKRARDKHGGKNDSIRGSAWIYLTPRVRQLKSEQAQPCTTAAESAHPTRYCLAVVAIGHRRNRFCGAGMYNWGPPSRCPSPLSYGRGRH